MSNFTKKPRALPKVWKRVIDIQRGDLFYVGKTLVQKTGFCFARAFEFDSCLGRPLPVGDLHVLWPWKRVKTTQLVRDAKPGGKSSATKVHSALGEPRGVEYQVLKDLRDSGLGGITPSEPNNDNLVTGPSS